MMALTVMLRSGLLVIWNHINQEGKVLSQPIQNKTRHLCHKLPQYLPNHNVPSTCL